MKVEAPWTPEQVNALNDWQRCGWVHPFTCGNERMDHLHTEYQKATGGDFGQLIATEAGWVCPVCGYRQGWAHDFMFEDQKAMRGPFFEPKP